MKTFNIGLKYKILSLLIFCIFTSALLLTLSTYQKMKNDILQKNYEVFRTFVNIFYSEKDILIKKYSMALDILLENRPLVEAFRDRDRETLKTLVTELYSSRLKHLYDIEQFQFHTPPAKSFYRAHAPSKYDDDLSSFRKTVLIANRDKNMVTGLEIGRAGLGLRVVKPVWSHYNFLGTVEFGGNIENLLSTPAHSTGVEYAVGVFTKSLQRSKFFYQDENRFTYNSMYLYNYSSGVIKSLITSGNMNREDRIIRQGDSYYMVRNIPLKDFSADQIGYLLLSRDTTAEVTAMHRELTRQIIITLSYTVGIALLLTFIMIKMIFSPLDKITRHISSVQIDSAAPTDPIIIKGESEISMLANAYNILSRKLHESFEKINNQINEIQIINTSLENRVKQRTKQLEDTNTRLKSAMSEIQMANEAKSEFLASMSHEIRTPMNAVLGLSYLLMQTELSSRQYDYVSKVRSSANMLLGIINDILDFSKIEAGKLELNRAPFDLKGIITRIGSMTDVAVSKRNIRVETVVDPSIPDYVFGDQLRVSQVLNNLAVNAAKFTEEGKITIKAKLTASNDNYAKVKLTVEDTGIGIPGDKLPILFDSFTQVNRKKDRKHSGSGLGLSICKKILDAMNSEISVESTEGKGSVFTFSLTLEIADDTDVADIMEDETSFIGKRVLVCEHTPDSVNSISSFFRENLADVLSVSNQFDLIKHINNNMDCRDELTFSLILIDSRVVSIDTFESLSTVLADTDASKFPPVLIIADDSEFASKVNSLFPHLRIFIIDSSSRDKMIPKLSSDILSYGKDSSPDVECFKKYRMSESSIKALIVDDNDINLQVITEFADILGLSYKTARNGYEAVRAAEEEEFDIIFMDLIMPGMDGLAAAEQIRRNQKTGDVPIYALTASTMAEDIEKCRKIGMNGHIAKPIKLKDLTLVLKELGSKQAYHAPEPEIIDVTIPKGDEVLNVDIAITYLNGNKKLYYDLLEKFYSEYSGLDIKAAEIIDTGSQEQAKSFFHTIKGVTKTIGALYISTQCEVLEKMSMTNRNIKESQTFRNFRHAVAELDSKLGEFFRSQENEE